MKMRRGQEIKIKLETVNEIVKQTMNSFQKWNNPTVSNWQKTDQRIQVKWNGQNPMWFDRNQVEKA